jgi:hypothetical protein
VYDASVGGGGMCVCVCVWGGGGHLSLLAPRALHVDVSPVVLWIVPEHLKPGVGPIDSTVVKSRFVLPPPVSESRRMR